MSSFSFIHTSDVHLGHQQFNLEERFHDFGLAFRRVVDYALAKKVDFLIIGGDFFHKRAINAETLKQAMELLQPLKDSGIPVVAIEGNHDKAFYQDKSSWLKLLNSLGCLTLLKPVFVEGQISFTPWTIGIEGSVLETEAVRIVGLGYLGATTEQRLAEAAEHLPPSDKFTIMVLHAAVNKLLGQDLGGVKTEVLDAYRDKVDYLALGHIHSRMEDGWMFNPGSLENCHIDEAKEGREKGFYHVSVEGREMNVEYIPSQPRPVRLVHIDITGAADPAEVFRMVRHAVSDLQLKSLDKPMLQLILHGEICFSAVNIDSGQLARDIKESEDCLYVEIRNAANLPVDGDNDNLTGGIDRSEIEKKIFKQLTARRLPQYRDFTDEIVNLIVRVKEAALAGESGEDIINRVSSLADILPEEVISDSQDEIAAEGGESVADQASQASEY